MASIKDAAITYEWIETYSSKSSKAKRLPRVIFNEKQGMTIVIFPDGEKVTSKCTFDNEFDPEVGVAMCIAKKHYTRGEIKRMVRGGHDFVERKGE